MKKLTATVLAGAVIVLPACRETREGRYPFVDHVVIQEIEASSVFTEPEVELWVVMVPEGDFRERCASNLGGTYRPDGHRYCIVPGP